MDEPIRLPSLDPIEEPVDLQERIESALIRDDKKDFLKLIKDPGFEGVRGHFHADRVFQFNAVNCAASIIAGETQGIIDLQDVLMLHDGLTPLHLAAYTRSPAIVKFLLDRGADINAKCDFPVLNLKQATPLDIAIEATAHNGRWSYWTPQKSIFELLVGLCGFHWRSCMEIARLIIQNTQHKEEVVPAFIKYAQQGKLVQTGVLFMVAPDLLFPSRWSPESGIDCFDMIHKDLKSKETRTEIEEGLLLLFDAFARMGDKLAAYIRLDLPVWGVMIETTVSEVACLLRESVCNSQGESHSDDYFVRFFKPLVPQAQHGSMNNSDLVRMVYEKNGFRLEGSMDTKLLHFYMKRRDINLDYINSVLPNLSREEADNLSTSIEKKLSMMFPLHILPQKKLGISNGGWKESQLPPLPSRIQQPSRRSFSTGKASSKPVSNIMSTKRENRVQPFKLKPIFSTRNWANIISVTKRFVK